MKVLLILLFIWGTTAQKIISSCSNLTSISNNDIVYLNNNITCNSNLNPLQCNNLIFYGQNNTISNLNITTSSSNSGLFGICTNLTIFDVNFEDCFVKSNSNTSTSNVGIVVGNCNSCNLKNIKLFSSTPFLRNVVMGFSFFLYFLIFYC